VNGPAAAGRSSRFTRLGAICATLLCLVLPALVAGVRMAAPAGPDEVARLQRALVPNGDAAPRDSVPRDSRIAQQFYVAAVTESVLPADAAAAQAAVGRARLAQVAALLAIGGLVYLVVLQARGRVQALVAVVILTLLPAVRLDGHVLRPETPAVLLAMLATLLWQAFAFESRVKRSNAATVDVSRLGLGCCAMLASALAVATLPAYGAPLLVPGIVLTCAAVHLGCRAVRIGRWRGQRALPVSSLNRRLLPWTLASLLTPAVTLAILSTTQEGAGEGLLPTATDVGVTPANPVAAGLFWATMVLGACAAILRVARRMRHPGRIGPDLVLFAACAVVLAGASGRPAGFDSLPLAPAFAVIGSDGVWAIWMLATWLSGRRGR
jgi:hypothetical protein